MPYEISDLGAAANPKSAEILTKLNQQGAQSATLSQMAADLQANQQAAQQQQQEQGMTPQMQSYLQALAQQHAKQYQLAAANPNDAANMATAQAGMEQQTQQQSPYYPIMMQMAVQKQQADLALTRADAVDKTMQPMDGPLMMTDPNSGEHKIVYPDGSVAGQDKTGMPFRASPDNHPVTQATGGNVSPWAMNPVQKETEIAKAKANADELVKAQNDLVNMQSAADQARGNIDEMRKLNHLVPYGLTASLQGIVSNSTSNEPASLARMTPWADKGIAAGASARYKQLNSKNLLDNIKALTAGAGLGKLDMPIVNAASGGAIVDQDLNPTERDKGHDQVSAFINNRLTAQRNYVASLGGNPNPPSGQPMQPLSSLKKISASYFNEAVKKMGIPPASVLKILKDKGYEVAH